MKIMLQNHTFYPVTGGIENYLYYVSETLREMGHQPVILCEKHDHGLSDFETYNGINIIRHPYYNIPKLRLFAKPKIVSLQLKHFISRHVADIDLIISRFPHYCFVTTELELDVPIFYIPPCVYWKQVNRASSNLSTKAKFFNLVWKNFLDSMEKKSLIRSSKTIVFSKNNADSLMRYHKLREFEFHIIPPGVCLNRFNRVKELNLLEQLKISKGTIVLLFVGRLSAEKNVDRLLRDLASLREANVKLVIVGDGPERRRLEKISNILKLREMVSFVGMRNDVERFYSIAEIFISPSKYEAFGQVLLEAMAAGLPCMAFKRVLPEYEVAADEIIEDAVTGYCVNPYERNEFRQRLLYLIENPDVRKRMGEAGRRVCERKFTWESHVRRLLDLVSN